MFAASPTDHRPIPPMNVIADLFEKFGAVYGRRQVLSMCEADDDAGLRLIQEEWRQRLIGIRIEAIDWAFENLGDKHPEWMPNVLQFVNLCKEWRPPLDLVPLERRVGHRKLVADPARTRAILEEALKRQREQNAADPLAWARRLKAREEAGEDLSITQKKVWRQVLKHADIETTGHRGMPDDFRGVPAAALPERLRPAAEPPGAERFGPTEETP